LHQGLFAQCLDRADEGREDDTCHRPASAQEADRSSPRHNYLYLGAELTRLTLSVRA
jgi:hypothetical protein